MEKKYLLLLFGLALIPFGFYFLRQDLIGADSYLYLLGVCHKSDGLPFNNPLLTDGIQASLFGFIPCDLFVIKAILLGLFLLSLFAIVKTAELIDKENAWLAGISCLLLTSLLFFEFFKFENDQFGWPLLFISIYFWVKSKKQNNYYDKIIALLFVGIAGLIWQGAILFLFGFGLDYLPVFFLGLLTITIVNIKKIVVFLPNFAVTENWPVLGLTVQQFLLAGFFKIPNIVFSQTIFFGILAALNAKYSILLLPFLAIGTMEFIKNFKPQYKTFLFGLCLGFYFITIINVFSAEPTNNEWQAIEKALSYSNSIQNDWDLGYKIAWKGGFPSAWAGGDANNFSLKGIILTQFNQPCKQINSFKELKIYDCN